MTPRILSRPEEFVASILRKLGVTVISAGSSLPSLDAMIFLPFAKSKLLLGKAGQPFLTLHHRKPPYQSL